MLKRDITFENLNGETRTKAYWFNLSKLELTKMQFGPSMGMEALVRQLIAEKDIIGILGTFETIIGQAVGVRSEDDERFLKSEAIKQDFITSPAYEALVFDLITNAEHAIEFITGIVPGEFADEIKKRQDAGDLEELTLLQSSKPVETVELGEPSAPELEAPVDNRPAWEKEDRDPTKDELLTMPYEELQKAFVARAKR